MVAEPVEATVNTLGYYYNESKDFLSEQFDELSSSWYYNKLKDLSPFSEQHAEKEINNNKGWEELIERITNNFSRNRRRYFSVITLGIGFLVYKCYGRYPGVSKKKRKAPILANGARYGVILIVGSPTEPLTRLIALDLEKRGYLVYMTVFDEKDLRYVQSNSITEDIEYLELTDINEYEGTLKNFRDILNTPVVPFHGAKAHNLKLMGVVFSPSLFFPIGPIENISLNSWNRVNARLMTYLSLFSNGLIDLIRSYKCNTIFVSTTILSSLSMPYHAPENIFQSCLKSLFTTLTRELRHHGLSVTQVRLGNLNISNHRSPSASGVARIINSEISNWDSNARDLYAADFASSQKKLSPMKISGRVTSLRVLHRLIFDLVNSKKSSPSLVYCGTGARTYEWISRILPESWLEWFLA